MVLVAAVFHATWNALVKKSNDPLLALVGLRLIGLPIAVVLLILFPWPSKQAVPYLIGNVGFMYVYYYFLLNTYRHGEFSSVYPISRGVAPLGVLCAAYLFGIDTLSSKELLATLLLSLGIIIFASQRHVSLPTLAYAIGTGISIAGYTFLAGAGVRQSESALGYLAWSEILTALGLITLSARLRKGQIAGYVSSHWWRIFASGSLSIAGFGIVLAVFQVLPLGPVTAVRESSIAFAVLIGVVFLKESFGLAKALALTLVCTGITVTALF